VKSSCFKKDDERVTPLLFLIDDSTLRSTFPCNLLAGKMLIIFELMFNVASVEGANGPVRRSPALHRPDRKIKYLFSDFPPGL